MWTLSITKGERFSSFPVFLLLCNGSRLLRVAMISVTYIYTSHSNFWIQFYVVLQEVGTINLYQRRDASDLWHPFVLKCRISSELAGLSSQQNEGIQKRKMADTQQPQNTCTAIESSSNLNKHSTRWSLSFLCATFTTLGMYDLIMIRTALWGAIAMCSLVATLLVGLVGYPACSTNIDISSIFIILLVILKFLGGNNHVFFCHQERDR